MGLFDFLSEGRKERFRSRLVGRHELFRDLAEKEKCPRSDVQRFRSAFQSVLALIEESRLPPNTGYAPSRALAFARYEEPDDDASYALLGILAHHITVEDRECCLEFPPYPIVQVAETYACVANLIENTPELADELGPVLKSLRAALYGIAILQMAGDMAIDAQASFEAGRPVDNAGWANLHPGDAIRRHTEEYPAPIHSAIPKILTPNADPEANSGDLITLLEAALCFSLLEGSPGTCPTCVLFESLADAWGALIELNANGSLQEDNKYLQIANVDLHFALMVATVAFHRRHGWGDREDSLFERSSDYLAGVMGDIHNRIGDDGEAKSATAR